MPSLMPMVPLGAADQTWRKRAIHGTQGVIIEAVAGNDEHDGESQQPRKPHPKAMSALGILAGYKSSLDAGIGTHGFSPNSTWMVARNLR